MLYQTPKNAFAAVFLEEKGPYLLDFKTTTVKNEIITKHKKMKTGTLKTEKNGKLNKQTNTEYRK